MNTKTNEQLYNERQQLATTSRKLQANLIALIGNDAYITLGTNRTHMLWLQIVADEVTSLATEDNSGTEEILELIRGYPQVNDAYALADKYLDPKQFVSLCQSLVDEIEESNLALFGDNPEEGLKLLAEVHRVQTMMTVLKFQMNSVYGRTTK